ncbi:GDP-fucose transporter 1-like [Adelges cooleyi]|uniref:GDP-fucose transporter 1-like n=1 Tax=Adelges cooleyi TaxID=133065 RepID=UPI00217F2610|nr:GDP-fucose transporter 1-like [Adelges cooleyi]XP_050431004.1 GDP-fucose transporter 1-like [Adelges cooleyi]XP_050431005.1 GDP-fucose transporter 1-like [Adelges cooleyi]XP_050431006.1 GDP-fucose transporter 1-like [Adelges cooleyi]
MTINPLCSNNYAHIFAVVVVYWIVSIVVVFINKALLSSQEFDINVPLFIAWFQCLVSALICFTFSILSIVFPKIIRFPRGNPLQWQTIKKVTPLTILFILMLSTNNYCLKFLGVTFYYVGRSLTTVFNVILSYLILGEKTSMSCLVCCFVITSGFILGIDQENLAGSFSAVGTVFGVLSSFSMACYSIQINRLLPDLNNQIWLLTYYNNVYATVLFLPLLTLEAKEISDYSKLMSRNFVLLMIVGGVCALLVSYVTALQVQVTSPLTHNISGTAKACFQTVLASYVYHEWKSTLWWLSNIIVLGGSAAYTVVRNLEMGQNQ